MKNLEAMNNKFLGPLIILLAIIVAIVVAGLIVGSNESAPTTYTQSTATTTPVTSSTQSTHQYHVGDMVSLNSKSGDMVNITLLQVMDPAPLDQYTTPTTGSRAVAVKVGFRNISSSEYSGNANGQVTVVGSDSQTYTYTFFPVTECTNFNYGSIDLGGGEDAIGCVSFQLPNEVTIKNVKVSTGLYESTSATWVTN